MPEGDAPLVPSGDLAPAVPTLALGGALNDAACWDFFPESPSLRYVPPGHGGRTGVPTSLVDMADEVAGELDALAVSQVDVLGVAMGAMIAQHLAVRHPARVRSLLLTCTTASCSGVKERLLDRAAGLTGQPSPTRAQDTLERWFSADFLAEGHPAVEYARECIDRTPLEVEAGTWRAIAGHDSDDAVRLVDAPVTLLTAEDDRVLGRQGMADLAKLLPRTRRISVLGPHMLHLERPEALHQAWRGHLAWVSERATDNGSVAASS